MCVNVCVRFGCCVSASPSTADRLELHRNPSGYRQVTLCCVFSGFSLVSICFVHETSVWTKRCTSIHIYHLMVRPNRPCTHTLTHTFPHIPDTTLPPKTLSHPSYFIHSPWHTLHWPNKRPPRVSRSRHRPGRSETSTCRMESRRRFAAF